MACYSKDCKKMSAKVVFGLSIATVLMGFILLIMALVMMKTWDQDAFRVNGVKIEGLSYTNTIAGLALVIGIVALLVGVCGILAGRK